MAVTYHRIGDGTHAGEHGAMMQVADHLACAAACPGLDEAPVSPAAMARYLRRTNGDAALCFAQAIHDGSAWASEAWGEYWAAVVRLVSRELSRS